MRNIPRNPVESTLPERIKTLRKRLALSTEQFGRLFFVSPRTVEQWEQGRREPQGMTRDALEKEMAKRRDEPQLF